MDRDRLMSLLDTSDEAPAACRAALRQGAPFVIDSDPLPASHMVRIYRRRGRLIKASGVPSLGFAEAVQALTDAGNLLLRLGSVTAADLPYHFQIFLSADASAVVACLGVDQAHRMIDRE